MIRVFGALVFTLTSSAGTAQALRQEPAARPMRIVSLSLASDEILLDLLPKCGGISRLAAVSTFADDPASSFSVALAKSVKNRVHSEPEAVLTLKPDLVIAASFNRMGLIELIQKKKIPILVLSRFSSHNDIRDNILALGKATMCEKPAAEMAEQFIEKIATIRKASAVVKRETAVYYSASLSTMAAETLFDDLLTMNNLENVASRAGLKHWPTITQEALRRWNPDWVVVPCEQDACNAIAQELKKQTAWRNLQAVERNHFIFVPSRDLMTTSQHFGSELFRGSRP